MHIGIKSFDNKKKKGNPLFQGEFNQLDCTFEFGIWAYYWKLIRITQVEMYTREFAYKKIFSQILICICRSLVQFMNLNSYSFAASFEINNVPLYGDIGHQYIHIWPCYLTDPINALLYHLGA